MEIKTKKHFNEIMEEILSEIIEEEELDEITVTGNIDGYNTPMAFTGKKGKKKKKKVATNSTGYSMVSENLDDKDLVKITKLIKNVVADIIRDIWLKRSAWQR